MHSNACHPTYKTWYRGTSHRQYHKIADSDSQGVSEYVDEESEEVLPQTWHWFIIRRVGWIPHMYDMRAGIEGDPVQGVYM